ncbi:fibronectin type III domain-containing protein, partial [bacterium]|nr:fibronectin type III domain-containing protein [bacterium]
MRSIAVILLLAAFVWASTEADLSVLSQHERELVLSVWSVVSPELVPSGEEINVGRCATPIFLEVQREWESLSPKARELLRPALLRPSLPHYIDSPTGHFRVYYTTTGTDATNIATVQLYAAYLDSAWIEQVTIMGFAHPPYDGGTGGGTNLYDAYIQYFSSSTYGYCQSDGQVTSTPWDDRMSYVVLKSDLSGESNPTACAANLTAHEFHHAIQFGYTFNSLTWWMENCAVWAEHAVWPEYPGHELQLEWYQDAPHISQTYYDGSHEYGGGIWAIYLWETYGTPFFAGPSGCWENHKYSTDDIATLDTTLIGYGSTFDLAYARYSGWRYVTGARSDGAHFTEAALYPDVALSGDHNSYPAHGPALGTRPYPVACNVVRFRQNDGGSIMDLSFDGDDAAQFDVRILRSDGIGYVEDIVSLGAGNTAALNITDWATVSDMAMIVTNTAHSGGQANFTYNATVSGSPMSPPMNLNAQSMLSGHVSLTWTPPGAAVTGYTVYRAQIATGPYSTIGTPGTASFDDLSVINGQIYYYRVRANYSSGSSRYSERVAAAPSGSCTGGIDTLWATAPGPYYGSFSGYDGFKLRAEFTPIISPGRIIAVEINLQSSGSMQPTYFDLTSASSDDPLWIGDISYVSTNWNTFYISDTLIFFSGDFAAGCVFRDGSISISTSGSGSGMSYYWSGSSWVSNPSNFAIRAIVQYAIPTSIAEVAPPVKPSAFEITAYPNPFNSAVKIAVDGVPSRVEIFD